LDPTTKAQATEEKTDKLDIIKTKLFCASKDTIMEWEIIFASHITDGGLISRIYKELLQLKNKKTKQSN